MKKIRINGVDVTIYDFGAVRIDAKNRREADIIARYLEAEGFAQGKLDSDENT